MGSQNRSSRISKARSSERPAGRADVRVADRRLFFVNLGIGTNRHNAVGEYEVARLQSARKRADDAGPDYQLCTGYQIERAPRGFCRVSMPDSVADHGKLLASDLRAKAMQAVDCERRAIAQPALEARDLPREGVEDKNQSRGLTLAFQNALERGVRY